MKPRPGPNIRNQQRLKQAPMKEHPYMQSQPKSDEELYMQQRQEAADKFDVEKEARRIFKRRQQKAADAAKPNPYV